MPAIYQSSQLSCRMQHVWASFSCHKFVIIIPPLFCELGSGHMSHKYVNSHNHNPVLISNMQVLRNEYCRHHMCCQCCHKATSTDITAIAGAGVISAVARANSADCCFSSCCRRCCLRLRLQVLSCLTSPLIFLCWCGSVRMPTLVFGAVALLDVLTSLPLPSSIQKSVPPGLTTWELLTNGRLHTAGLIPKRTPGTPGCLLVWSPSSGWG